MYRKDKLSVIFLITALIFSHAAIAENDRDKELLLGVAPIMSPDALFKRLAPLSEYLSDEMDREVVIELNSSVDQLIERTDAGRYDMVLTGPNFALRAFDSGLYVPGVIPGKLTTGVLIVNSSSSIKTIDQLKGKVISTPRKKGTLGVIVESFFLEHGFEKEDIPKIINYASHNAAFLAMQYSDVDAAFIAEFGYRHLLSDEATSSIVEIGRTKPFPGLSIIISSRVSNDMHEEIVNSMLGLSKSERGKIVLKKISFPPFRRYSIDEFDSIRHYFKNKIPGKR